MTFVQQEDRKPVIAILTVADPYRKFCGNHANFRDIVKTGKQLGYLVYVVTTRDLKLNEDQIQGYIYQTDTKQWVQQWVPLPDVIYNRIPNRGQEKKVFIQRKIDACLNHPRIHLFNPFFFNKWKLFSWLKKSGATADFVPATKRFGTRSALAEMLNEHAELYLKPESGKAGKGIMKLTFDSQDSKPYKLIIQNPERNLIYKTAKFPLLWRRIRAEMDKTPYIIQQAIRLTRYQCRHFDLRVLVQKTSRGYWSVTGIGARLAGKKRITTHVPQGGTVEDPRDMLLPTFGPEGAEELLERARASAVTIARQIERACEQTLGEMSMDLGIDEDGKIWFFEANAKPMKFDEPKIRQKSLQRLFHYSSFLSRTNKV
ncbi:YheC/YheD family protein [Paenibacillus pinistramenti]|uniref:YheC/YheD family endospore coat-associated protein n=1 Tax=Paenibacillus pinistramenti TaxID=1768003 RepID=UPI001108525A|nr:YheC/YheD family protein [Paenibacillus pinistramenti]